MSHIPCKQWTRFTECTIGDEHLLMDMENGGFFTLRGSAAVIWTLIDGIRDREDIASTLHRQFDGSIEQIDCEMKAFLGDLREAGFVA